MLHIKLPHNSLFPESAQQGETPGRDYMNEARREEGALMSMETGSLALQAGKPYKPQALGIGCDIMQAFRTTSCSGSPRQHAVKKGRVIWVRLPSNQLLRLWLWLHEWNDRKPPPSMQSQRRTQAQAHQSNTSALNVLLNGKQLFEIWIPEVLFYMQHTSLK